MATSGSWNSQLTAANIIQAALEDLGVLGVGATITSADQTMALSRLNMLVKQWQGTSDLSPGLQIWRRQRVTLALAKGQQSYLIGPASTDARASTQMGRTTLSAAEAAGQTTLSITSNTDTTTYPGTTITMTASDIVGIELDDGTIQWTTISGTPTTTMDVAVALTGAAASGNYVWWFTSRAQRMLTLEAAVIRTADRTDSPLTIYKTIEEYEEGVADKYADGAPTCLLWEPLRLNTRVTFDAQPTDVTDQVILTGQYPAEDYDATTDDIELPQEGFAALSWALALRCAPAFGVQWGPVHQANYQDSMAMYRNLNPEVSTAYFQPGGP